MKRISHNKLCIVIQFQAYLLAYLWQQQNMKSPFSILELKHYRTRILSYDGEFIISIPLSSACLLMLRLIQVYSTKYTPLTYLKTINYYYKLIILLTYCISLIFYKLLIKIKLRDYCTLKYYCGCQFYLMETQKRYFSVNNNRKVNSRILPSSKLFILGSVKPVNAQYSLGKSSIILKASEKIQIIKNACFKQAIKLTPTLSSNPKDKLTSLANQQDLDVSCMLSQQDDIAELQPHLTAGSTLMLISKFRNRPKTVLFRYPACCQKSHPQTLLRQKKRISQLPAHTIQKMRYRIYGSEYRCIVNAFQVNGFEKVDGWDWHVFFDVRGSKVKITHNKMYDWQRFNHFAGCWSLGRKDQMWRHGYKQAKLFPQQYNFLPRTFILPYDFQRFQHLRQSSSKNHLWIQKPVASSKGRNIRVFSNQAKISNRKNTLISEYIENPHLINNLKYDLRIYVLVTSFNPLKIYIYENGLARFATGQYKTKGPKDKFVHLTNFSVNKHSRNFVPPSKNTNNTQQQQCNSSKWSLTKLRQYYISHGIDPKYIFKQVEDIVIKTCISVQSSMLAPKFRNQENKNCAFQLFGFDILIDDKFKAWLMEVNVCPSLCSSSPFDKKIKHTLIVDLLNLVGINPPKQQNDSQLSENSPKQLSKKYRFKNPMSISTLDYKNCLDLLAPQDWLIIIENQQQLDRMALGNFERAFPRKDNILEYQKFFQCPRYNNFVLWKHMLSEKGFLSRLHI